MLRRAIGGITRRTRIFAPAVGRAGAARSCRLDLVRRGAESGFSVIGNYAQNAAHPAALQLSGSR